MEPFVFAKHAQKYISGTLAERRIYPFLEPGTHKASAFKPHMHAAESTENISCNCENKVKSFCFFFFLIRPILTILRSTTSHDASFATILLLYYSLSDDTKKE